MKNKTVSIVLATYQGEKYLAEQLDSLINQSYPEVMIYVFDDGSTDNTLEILKDYQAKFTNIKVSKNSVNLGFVKNFMQGIGQVGGKYIALCDQDDIWHYDKLSICMKEMEALEIKYPNTPILVHSDLEMINEEGNIIYKSFFNFRGINKLTDKKNLSHILGHNGVMGNSLLINKKLAVMLNPYPERLKDHDYWIAVVNEVSGVRKTILRPLLKYRIHGDNTSNSLSSIHNKSELVEFIQELFSGDAPLPFMENNRLEVIEFLKHNYDISNEDRTILKVFVSYLEHNDTRYNLAKKILRHNFIKPSILYRIHFLLNIWTTDRYKE